MRKKLQKYYAYKVDFNKEPIWEEISKEEEDLKKIDMKNALEYPWFKKFDLVYKVR